MQSDLGAVFGNTGLIVCSSYPEYAFGPLGSSSFTISVLFCSTSAGTILSWNGPISSQQQGMVGWILAVDVLGSPRFSFSYDTNGNWRVYGTTEPELLLDGCWHQVVVMWQSGNFSMQVDGAEISVTRSSAVLNANTQLESGLFMGKTIVPGQPYPQFTGTLEDVIFFQKALTNDQITACRFNLITRSDPGLVGLWRLNGDTTDDSPLQNDGQGGGAISFVPVFHTVWAQGDNGFSYVSMETRYGTPDYGPPQTPKHHRLAPDVDTVSRKQTLSVGQGSPYLAFLIYGDDGTFAYPPGVQCTITLPDSTTISTDSNTDTAYVAMFQGSPWKVLIKDPQPGLWVLTVSGPSTAEFTLGFQTLPSGNIRQTIEDALGPCYPSQNGEFDSQSDFLFATGAGIVTALAAASVGTGEGKNIVLVFPDVLVAAAVVVAAVTVAIVELYLSLLPQANLGPDMAWEQIVELSNAETQPPRIEVCQALVKKVGTPATTDPKQFASRADMGVAMNYQLTFDLGGEGFHRVKGITSGFMNAINFNDHTHDSTHPSISIPNLVLMNSFSTSPAYPVAAGTGNYVVMQDAPLTDWNVLEIARILAPAGNVGLWIDQSKYATQIANLAAVLQTVPSSSSNTGSCCQDEFNGQLPYPKICLYNESTSRVIFYATNFTNMQNAIHCAEDGYITHVLIGLFHCGFDKTGAAYIHLNDLNPTDPSYDQLWKDVETLQALGVRVMASLGGGRVRDFTNLFTGSQYSTFYPLLKTVLQEKKFDGLDLDIEENAKVVNNRNVEQLVHNLRIDFQNHSPRFLISSAPVAKALTGQGSVSYNVSYPDLIDLFDFYILQFYNNWGDLNPNSGNLGGPHYADVIRKLGVTHCGKLVAGVLTNPKDAGDPSNPAGYYNLATVSGFLPGIISAYPTMGGICGWTYQNALDIDGKENPLGWAQVMANTFARAFSQGGNGVARSARGRGR